MKDRIALYADPVSSIKSYYEMVDFASENGLKNLETLNLYEFEEPNLEFAKKLKKYADEKNVKIICVSAGINLVGEDGRENIEKAKKYAEIAAILDAPYFHHTIVDCLDRDCVAGKRDEYLEEGVRAVQEIYDYAESIGIKTIFEDQGFVFNGVEAFKRFLAEADRDFKIVADVGNIFFIDEKIEDFISEFSDRIVHVHIKDYKYLPKDTEVEKIRISFNKNKFIAALTGEGDVDFDRVFKLLKKIKYKGYFSLEGATFDSIENFNKNVEFVEKHIASLDD